MQIKIDRQSVCMGDDMENHEMIQIMEEDTTFVELFKKLISKNYFPYLGNHDIVWVLRHNGQDIVSWKNKENKFYTCFTTNEPAIESVKRWRDNLDVVFIYYSSAQERAKSIFEKHGGNKFQMGHEGYLSEYQSYNISTELEKTWVK